jgi:hypothetical protein
MTLVFTSKLGQLAQSQFGVNEIASCVIVGKAIGSVFTRQSDASVFGPLQQEYGLFIRRIPKYLESVEFDRTGTILGNNQRKIKANNMLEGVVISSIEGIATFMVLILRHIQGPGDLVDYLEDLLQGHFGIVGRTESDHTRNFNLPYSLRDVLRSFVTAVADADADSPALNSFRNSMGRLVEVVGDSNFLDKATDPTQHEQDRLLGELLRGSDEHGERVEASDFHTFSASAAIIALAAASNGANIEVKCQIGLELPMILVGPRNKENRRGHTFIFTLWVVQPPIGVSESLRSVGMRDLFKPRSATYGPLPIIGGMLEISKIIARQLGCLERQDEQLALWENAVTIGAKCVWQAALVGPNLSGLAYKLSEMPNTEQPCVPTDLSDMASQYYQAPRGDPRHGLARKVASILHDTLKYYNYDGFEDTRFRKTMNFVVVAFFTGCIGALASNSMERLSSYAWTADCSQLKGYAEMMVCQGLTINRLVMTAARIWGGLPPSFNPQHQQESRVMGIACPQTTILLNVLSNPQEVAEKGVGGGLFTLHQGSIPMIPRDQYSGLIYAGEKRFRKPIQDVDASCQIPMEDPVQKQIIFTLEPGVMEGGSLSVLLCGWIHGHAALELNPFMVLSGLISQRQLKRNKVNSPVNEATPYRTLLSHMCSRELLSYQDGFKVREGVVLFRAGPRLDLQIAAAGLHLGSRTVMVVEEEDAALIRENQKIMGSNIELFHSDDIDILSESVIIFCTKDFPPHLGTAHLEEV